jgi:hypothetical protein
LRDSSGTNLLPEGCEACDCVVLNGDAPDDGCNCELASTRERGREWWALGLLLGLGSLFLVSRVARARCRASFSR